MRHPPPPPLTAFPIESQEERKVEGEAHGGVHQLGHLHEGAAQVAVLFLHHTHWLGQQQSQECKINSKLFKLVEKKNKYCGFYDFEPTVGTGTIRDPRWSWRMPPRP